MYQATTEEYDYHALTPFLPSIDSHHGGTCYIPVGKSVGKPRGKATNQCFNIMGNMTLLLQLGRKLDVHTPTQDEDMAPLNVGGNVGVPLERKV